MFTGGTGFLTHGHVSNYFASDITVAQSHATLKHTTNTAKTHQPVFLFLSVFSTLVVKHLNRPPVCGEGLRR